MHFTSTILNTLETKYPNKKNIGIIKSSLSTALYLKSLIYKGYVIDFLNCDNLSKERLKKYDLIILENEFQDTDTFRAQDVDPQYVKTENALEFKDPKALNCFYNYPSHLNNPYIDEATEKICFTLEFIKQNNLLKLDYKEEFERKNAE